MYDQHVEYKLYKNSTLFVNLNREKVYFKSQILVHEYWTILDHFCVPVLKASE